LTLNGGALAACYCYARRDIPLEQNAENTGNFKSLNSKTPRGITFEPVNMTNVKDGFNHAQCLVFFCSFFQMLEMKPDGYLAPDSTADEEEAEE
jgi:hypothetical protein